MSMYNANGTIISVGVNQKVTTDTFNLFSNLYEFVNNYLCNVYFSPTGSESNVDLKALLGDTFDLSVYPSDDPTSEDSQTFEDITIDSLLETYLDVESGTKTFKFDFSYLNRLTSVVLTYSITIEIELVLYNDIEVRITRDYHQPKGIVFNKSLFKVYLVDKSGALHETTDYTMTGYTKQYINDLGLPLLEDSDISRYCELEAVFRYNDGDVQLSKRVSNLYAIYDIDLPELSVVNNDDRYFVNETFKTSSLDVKIKYRYFHSIPIPGRPYTYTYYEKQIFSGFDTSIPNGYKFLNSDIGTKTLTITYGDLESSLTLNVLAKQQNKLLLYLKEDGSYKCNEFGEIEQDFNLNITIDGTKDSCKLVVSNFCEEEIKPYTICYMPLIDKWFIVKQDKCQSYAHEEYGLWYKHEIQLEGAIGLLGARDLTNCGFNKDRYTVDSFIRRLFALSDFEFDITIDYNDILDSNKIVTYLKTFSNYSPLSALKEFLNGYNCLAKLNFTTSGDYLDKANVTIISKEGLTNIPILDYEDDFDSVATTRVSTSTSYGNKVISNAQNVVSTQEIIYPSFGGIRFCADEYITKYGSAYLPLQSKVYKALELQVFGCLCFKFRNQKYTHFLSQVQRLRYENRFNDLKNALPSDVQEEFESKKEWLWQYLNTHTFLNIADGSYKYIKANPGSEWGGSKTGPKWLFTDRQHYDIDSTKWNVTYWEQGSNKIKNFEIFNKTTIAQQDPVDYELENEVEIMKLGGESVTVYKVSIGFNNEDTAFRVRYIPMTDIKIKFDSDSKNNNSKLYNQNGKLIDSFALGKLVDSYSKEISGSEITLNGIYYDFFAIPNVGQIVKKGNGKYIISNISYDFSENDVYTNVIECLFTLTKQVALKSTMISANTNIRDYDIPEKNNIVREQLYRDIYSLTQDLESTYNDSYYLQLKDLKFDSKQKGFLKDYVAYIKTDVGYYYLNSYNLFMPKQVISVCDFKDNNIIGYSIDASYTFNARKVASVFQQGNLYNTPISYVDTLGETKELSLAYVESSKSPKLYDTIAEDDIYLFTPSANKDIYDEAVSQCDFYITDLTYNKDGLEIPMFEYSMQVVDSNDVIFGSNFLNRIDFSGTLDFIEYEFVISDTPLNENNAISKISVSGQYDNIVKYYQLNNKATISFFGSTIMKIKLNATYKYYIALNTETKTDYTRSIKGKSIAIITHKVVLGGHVYGDDESNREVLLIVNNIENELDSNGEITLHISNYKSK